MLVKNFLVLLILLMGTVGCSSANQVTLEEGAGKTIEFSGYKWMVADSKGVQNGAGHNVWKKDNVWVDKEGSLHLKIAKKGDEWSCAEIWSTQDFEYGTYQFELASPIDTSDPTVVLGMFMHPKINLYTGKDQKIHDEINIKSNNEIDVELARWTMKDGTDGGFTVWANLPESGVYSKKEKSKKYFIPAHTGNSVHTFTWTEKDITFSSKYEGANPESDAVRKWVYKPEEHENRNVKPPLRAYLNLWLYRGDKDKPENFLPVLKEQEIIIKKFTYTPQK